MPQLLLRTQPVERNSVPQLLLRTQPVELQAVPQLLLGRQPVERKCATLVLRIQPVERESVPLLLLRTPLNSTPLRAAGTHSYTNQHNEKVHSCSCFIQTNITRDYTHDTPTYTNQHNDRVRSCYSFIHKTTITIECAPATPSYTYQHNERVRSCYSFMHIPTQRESALLLLLHAHTDITRECVTALHSNDVDQRAQQLTADRMPIEAYCSCKC